MSFGHQVEWAELPGEDMLRKDRVKPILKWEFYPGPSHPYSTLQTHPETQKCCLSFEVSVNICPQVHENSKPRDIPGPLTICHLL